jgi:hypothetical protein
LIYTVANLAVMSALFIGCAAPTSKDAPADPKAAAASRDSSQNAPGAEGDAAVLAAHGDDDGAEVDRLIPDVGNLRAFAELARSDIRLQKSLIIAQNLPLTEEEAAEFWPIHREYEQELAGLNDRRIVLIRKYLPSASEMTEAQARVLAGKVLDLESERTDLKRAYFERFQQAVPATKAARFFQIENQLNMVLDLRIAASLPLIK